MGNLENPQEQGMVFQNLMANILLEKIQWTGKTLHFWRTLDKAEVDLVVQKGMNVLPVEVKYTALQKPELTKSFRSFIEKYNPPEAWVINLTLKKNQMLGKTKVRFLPFTHLLGRSVLPVS